MKKTVAILGCGPAGLLAAQAAVHMDWNPVIVSRKEKSVIHGAQFLHEPITNVTFKDPDGHVNIKKIGSRDQYATKVYGNVDAPVSWDQYEEGINPVWSMEQAYDVMWDRFGSTVVDREITRSLVEQYLTMYDAVVSSIPLPALLSEGVFEWQDVWITDTVPRDMPPSSEHRNWFIEWDGNPEHEWYRKSYLFGNLSYEFGYKPSGFSTVQIRKPLWNANTNNSLPKMIRVGRYGEFLKGVLIHDAYHKTIEELSLL